MPLDQLRPVSPRVRGSANANATGSWPGVGKAMVSSSLDFDSEQQHAMDVTDAVDLA
jgi:hypothetical protein